MEPRERLPQGGVARGGNLRVFWQALTKGLLINVALREIFPLPPLLLLLMFVLPPGSWQGITLAISATAMLREMPPLLLPLMLMPGGWRGISKMAQAKTATATAMRQSLRMASIYRLLPTMLPLPASPPRPKRKCKPMLSKTV